MKGTFFKCLMALTGLVFAGSAMAQQSTRTIEFAGDITSYYDGFTGSDVASYNVVIELDDSATPTSASATSYTYQNTSHIQSVSVTYYDSMGQPLALPEATYFEPENYDYVNYERSNGFDTFWFQISGLGDKDIYFWFRGEEGSLFTSFSAQPDFAIGQLNISMSNHIYLDNVSYFHDDPNGTLTRIGEMILDDDGDGIANDVDACPISDMDETVMFDGWYDSNVGNHVDESGCTVADHYAACEVEEQEAPRRGMRSVRSGPSSCEKAVSYDLVADGVISYSEARMLRNALYESSTSSGRR